MLPRQPRPVNSARPRPRNAKTSLARGATATVLLTGFDAFGGEMVNPSWLAVQALHGKQVLGRKLVAAQLPTEFDSSLNVLRQKIDQYRPELVICVGQAGGRSAISLERVALNVNDARIPDNGGVQPVDTPVVAKGPAAYFTGLPIKAMFQALQKEDISVEVSQSAGTFVCNHVFYGLMHFLASQWQFKNTRGGFIHVPFLPEQAHAGGTPSMPLEDIVRGMQIAVRVALKNKADVALGAGAEQ
jgi:pyroglutamyl-peptidase